MIWIGREHMDSAPVPFTQRDADLRNSHLGAATAVPWPMPDENITFSVCGSWVGEIEAADEREAPRSGRKNSNSG